MTPANKFLVAGITMLALASWASAQPLSGPYTVGPAGTYPNIAAAIAALTTNGVGGPVTFTVQANDTGPWTIGAIPGQGPANPITFNGQGTAVLSGAVPILTLSGCSGVIISGFSTTLTAPASGAAFVIGAGTTNCIFRNCNFTATASTSGTSIMFSFTGGTGCTVEDSTWGGMWEAFNIGVGNDSTTFQRCLITGGGWWIGRVGGTNCTIRNNFISGISNYGISAGLSGTPTSGQNLHLYHNSIYIVHPTSGSQYCSVRWYSQATGTEVKDNIFFDNYPTSSTSVFNMWCSGTYRPAVMNYNCFWSNQAGYPMVYASVNQTLASWQALGYDVNSIQADPQYLAPTATPADLRLLQGSPCVMAGTTIATIPADFFGNPRTPPVDIGAHELSWGNLLAAVTTGGGVGDLSLSLTALSAGVAEGYMLISQDTTGVLGSGLLLGIRPDASTWAVFSFPMFPGNPFHFPTGYPGLFPAAPFSVGPGTLSSLAGTQLDAVTLLLGPGLTYIGQSNVVRIVW